MKYFKKMEGENVYLSPMNVEDYEIYTKWMNDNNITERLGSYSRVTNLLTEKEWIEKNLSDGSYQFAIVKKDTDELIGNCGIDHFDAINQKATVGLFIGEEKNRGKGYGSETLKLLLQYGFDYLNLNNIMLTVYSFNENAIKCYEKVGFKKIGTRRQDTNIKGKKYDTIYMDILRSEFYKG